MLIEIIEILEMVAEKMVTLGILFFEFVGMIILFVAGIRAAVIGTFKKGLHPSRTLARGMGMALEFLIGAEILRTVQTRDLRDLLLIAGIVVVRVALTVLIQRDMKEAHEFLEEYEKAKEAGDTAAAAEMEKELDEFTE